MFLFDKYTQQNRHKITIFMANMQTFATQKAPKVHFVKSTLQKSDIFYLHISKKSSTFAARNEK